ncbi:DUF599 domain-containing protein [Cereibacter azotoformans]|uniref:Membrane protein-like protein n=1 Tax=Cereibacter sphaeroides (strain ATCC 17025 / ATH 2.4.3) TaxID=349102 RepID=A4WP03_CERS5|nr:DUF599 domain-containing protein [Cereibacter azotoformans]ULB08518.1 DUF599 domain-containing protein [Cereibacter azotoformans]
MLINLSAALMPLDLLAVSLLLLAWAGTGYLCENPPSGRPSVSVLMKDHRRTWMREMVSRSPRIFDASVIDSLRRGTAFFASGSMIAIGGGMALIGNRDRLETLVEDLTLATDAVRLELRVILVLFIVANAFLKFVWAHRVFGYCAILMAAVPNDPQDARAYPLAAQAAEVNINAARNFNSGLRAVFFALAAIGWLLGPVALILTTLATSFAILRAEFLSGTRAAILDPSGLDPRLLYPPGFGPRPPDLRD